MSDMRGIVSRLTASASESAADLDRLRAILIAAGQWEQAATQSGAVDRDTLLILRELTDCAADAFCLAWRLQSTLGPRPSAILATYEMADPILEQVAPWIDGVSAQLTAVPASDIPLDVEMPVAFNIHAVYPEQYAAAAERWLRDRGGMSAAARAVVMGVGSVGTALSAVVAAALRLSNWRTARFVVWPGEAGEVSIPDAEFETVARSTMALIVDGDVRSGDACDRGANALLRAGIDLRYLACLPAVATVQEQFDCYHVPQLDLRIGGRSFEERLILRTLAYFASDCGLRDVVVEKIDGVEPGYRVALPDGRALNWRFAGLSIDAEGRPAATTRFDELRRLAELGHGTAPVDIVDGFVAVTAA